MAEAIKEGWDDGDGYERYMGRWSRPMAAAFLRRLELPAERRWLDVGCGTGALSQAILAYYAPRHVVGVDPSEGFVAYAARQKRTAPIRFCIAQGEALPVATGAFDAVVSGLALNFMPSPEAALAEMKRAVVSDGCVALYVWDYAGGMAPLRFFWDVAIMVNPAASTNEQGNRFPICRPDALRDCFLHVGFAEVTVEPLDAEVHFADFDAYWLPFAEGGPFPAPAYLKSRPVREREQIRAELLERLPIPENGSFSLPLRAWVAWASS